ncbi:ATP-dependent OLD family endonuclease [Bifidobacterium lemurum]|uniref:ATP-dependent OLD family endonuclease n=1 Tax=Bifidobacterium lemurum TaxID=1603886 RepID=A0A261FN30_9BIFI|nr:AAA family ATPase [Bifidobacterium lemurum]OZG60564.1 ATP-dependent OLD family endonuclease [Bifidobacterium lemurum]QOL34203.1 ATP-dependent endonuclease [Bifidobacterium lemurum]
MIIQKVKIQNFRTLYDATIDFSNITTLIGPNGAGKSTILYALDWFFNGAGNDLSDEDATYNHEIEPIVVRVTFSDLNDRDRDALGKYAPAGTTSFTAWKMRKDGREFLSANIMGNPLFTPIKQASKAAEKKDLYKFLRQNHPELDLPTANTAGAITDALTAWEQEHHDQLEEVREEVSTSFNGFNSNASMKDIFNYSLVRADYRASEESEDARTTLLGTIIERTIDRKAADDQISKLFNSLREQEQQIYQNTFGDQLDELSDQLNEIIGSYSAARNIRVEPYAQELKPARTTFKVSVLDGDNETAVSRQGHGFQRMLLISALQLLARRMSLKENLESPENDKEQRGVLCLAVEEPELYQHPIQARAFAHVLRQLGEAVNGDVQVLYATHSPYFIDPSHYEEVYRLSRRSMDGVPLVQLTHAQKKSVVDRLESGDHKGANNVQSRIGKTISENFSYALFANAVILVEGTSERAILSAIADKRRIAELERWGMSIVPCMGKSNIPYFHAILKEFQIPSVVVFDNDNGWENRFTKDVSKKNAEEQSHKNSNFSLVHYFHIEDKVNDDYYPSSGTYDLDNGDSVFIVEDTLEPFLNSQWKTWQDCYENINSGSKKNEEDYYRATLQASFEDCPKFLLNIIDRAVEKAKESESISQI